jgi:hypothetical protein
MKSFKEFFSTIVEAKHSEADYSKWGVIDKNGKFYAADEYRSWKKMNHAEFLYQTGLEKSFDLIGSKSEYIRYGLTKFGDESYLLLTIPKKSMIPTVIKVWNKLPISEKMILVIAQKDGIETTTKKAYQMLKSLIPKVTKK